MKQKQSLPDSDASAMHGHPSIALGHYCRPYGNVANERWMTPLTPFKELGTEAVSAVLAAGNCCYLRSGHRKSYTIFLAICGWKDSYSQFRSYTSSKMGRICRNTYPVDRGQALYPSFYPVICTNFHQLFSPPLIA